MKALQEFLTESLGQKIYLDNFDNDFQKKMDENCYNDKYPPFRNILSGGKLFNRYYTDQCYLSTNTNEGTITFVDRADFTSSITFKVSKSKLKSGNPISLDDLKKVMSMPASWGYLRIYPQEENVNACRALTCLIYNHSIKKDIDIPGIK